MASSSSANAKQEVALSREVPSLIESFITRLKRGKVVEAKRVALETAELLREIVSRSAIDDLATLTGLLRTVGKRLIAAQPRELIIYNVVCRILHNVKEEAKGEGGADEEEERAGRTKSGARKERAAGMGVGGRLEDGGRTDGGRGGYQLKMVVLEVIREFMDEVEGTEAAIEENAREHIHSNEIILTCGRSHTVERFLKHAASKAKRLHVIVAESAPGYAGQAQARGLASANIDVIVVSDAAVFGIMSRVNKVILGAHAVLANGGVVADSGAHMIAAAARHHATQVVVCAGQYKYSPLFPFDDDGFNTVVAPDVAVAYGDGALVGAVDVANPHYDYVPPELVDILVDQTGGHLPSYLYRLQQESYEGAGSRQWWGAEGSGQ
ncbi:GCD complex subunit gcd7 [Coemansia thaxteri]|uniref:Translation initiation factor eIF2B subunit beta n=1 Tax=Coemansia thaxteri TaxID=2663907 RepID=A0A9W8BAF1_9FUNG|nr:GCD complex subunit gcd7 [Coemansia thaxteri]